MPSIQLYFALTFSFLYNQTAGLDFDSCFPMQRIAGEIKTFSTDGWVSPKLSKRMDKFMLYVITAGKKALANGGITDEVMKELDKARCGVLLAQAWWHAGNGWFYLSLKCKIYGKSRAEGKLVLLELLQTVL